MLSREVELGLAAGIRNEPPSWEQWKAKYASKVEPFMNDHELWLKCAQADWATSMTKYKEFNTPFAESWASLEQEKGPDDRVKWLHQMSHLFDHWARSLMQPTGFDADMVRAHATTCMELAQDCADFCAQQTQFSLKVSKKAKMLCKHCKTLHVPSCAGISVIGTDDLMETSQELEREKVVETALDLKSESTPNTYT